MKPSQPQQRGLEVCQPQPSGFQKVSGCYYLLTPNLVERKSFSSVQKCLYSTHYSIRTFPPPHLSCEEALGHLLSQVLVPQLYFFTCALPWPMWKLNPRSCNLLKRSCCTALSPMSKPSLADHCRYLARWLDTHRPRLELFVGTLQFPFWARYLARAANCFSHSVALRLHACFPLPASAHD